MTISIWHLAWIIPGSALMGFLAAALLSASDRRED